MSAPPKHRGTEDVKNSGNGGVVTHATQIAVFQLNTATVVASFVSVGENRHLSRVFSDAAANCRTLVAACGDALVEFVCVRTGITAIRALWLPSSERDER
jgi:hypothetical protein